MDARDNRWSSTFDAVGNQLTEKDPLGREHSYVYDANRRRTERTDARDFVTTYAYDAVGQ